MTALAELNPYLHELLVQLDPYLRSWDEISLACVFGSFARGNPRASSDIDLAIAGPTLFSAEKRVELALAISQLCGREVDVVDLNAAHGAVFEEAMCKGVFFLTEDSTLKEKLLNRMLRERDFDGRIKDRMLLQRLKN